MGLNGMTWAVFVVPSALPIVVAMVVATGVPRGGDASPLIVMLSLVDRHGPNP